MADITEYEAEARATHAAEGAKQVVTPTHNFAVLPEGYRLESLERFQRTPDRKRGSRVVAEVDSLVAYVNEHATETSLYEVQYDDLWIRATLDWHKPGTAEEGSAGWGEHIATYKGRTGEKLAAWLAIADKSLSQIVLGEFLEERVSDIHAPEGADVMDMVLKFEATKKVSFKSSQRLHDGLRQLQYVEENEARGALTIPESFVLFVPVLRGMEPEPVKFWLRYRLDDGALRFTLKMHDKAEVFRRAFDRSVDAFRVGLKAERPILVVG